jgi:ribosomal protein L11 methylase PrmA
MIPKIEQSSFRDKDGFVFYANEMVYRAIHQSYKENWEVLSSSSFFHDFIKEGKLPAYTEETVSDYFNNPTIYKILKVQPIPFISYPNEWSFEQLKKAALLTLTIQKKALENNFTLKDASAFNVQFMGTKPLFIDTLSFEKYVEGTPWNAYGQFCRHFLAPLLLSAYGFKNQFALFIDNIDGLTLDMVSQMLPIRSKLNLLAYTHIHLHARFETKHADDKEIKQSQLKISKSRSLSILQHLEQGIKKLKLPGTSTNWTNYYDTFSYSNAGYTAKKEFVAKNISQLNQGLCIDLGANTGEFSELAAKNYSYVVACDNDIEVVRAIQSKKNATILALRINLSNPSPAYGWNGEERSSFIERAKKADMVLALALIHHICIGNNVPLAKLAAFFDGFAKRLIIEFVPKTDVQVKKLLVTKKDIFEDYNYTNFELEFLNYFEIIDKQFIPDSERVILLLNRKAN